MFIVNKDRSRIFNVYQYQQFCAKENSIQCTNGSEVVVIATYEDADRANEVFHQMLNELFSPNLLVLQNMDVPEDVAEVLKNTPVLMTKTPDNEPKIEAIRPYVWYMPE